MIAGLALILGSAKPPPFPLGTVDELGLRPIPVRNARERSLLKTLKGGNYRQVIRVIGKDGFKDGVHALLFLQAHRGAGTLTSLLGTERAQRFFFDRGQVDPDEVAIWTITLVMLRDAKAPNSVISLVAPRTPWWGGFKPSAPRDPVLLHALLSTGMKATEYGGVRHLAAEGRRLFPQEVWIKYWQAWGFYNASTSRTEVVRREPLKALKLAREIAAERPEVPSFQYSLAAFADGFDRVAARQAALRYLTLQSEGQRAATMREIAERNR